METKIITFAALISLISVFLCTATPIKAQMQKKEDLIGIRLKGYTEERALQDKLGFWSGAQNTYGEGKFTIERWENEKTKKLWLVLLENTDNKETIIRDILSYERSSVGDIGPFEIYDSKNKKAYSGYVMVQIAKKDQVVKIYDVDLNTKKIIVKDPESDSVKAQTEWDSY